MKVAKVIIFTVFALLLVHIIEYYLEINRAISGAWLMTLLYGYRFVMANQENSKYDYESSKRFLIFFVVGSSFITCAYFILRPYGDMILFSL